MSDEPLRRLIEIARQAGNSSEPGSYLQSILSAGVELTQSETASIMEYDPAARELRFAAVPWFHQDSLRPVKVPLEGSAAGWVIQTGQPLIIPDMARDSRHFRMADQASEYKTRSLLAVPLLEHGQPIGVLEVLNKEGEADYTDNDVTILETLAALACLTIRKEALERQAHAAKAETTELDRLKNDFIAITSHELRTPLGLIIGHATFLRESVPQELRDQVDTIIRNSTKIKEIIETLTDVDNYRSGSASLRQGRVSITQLVNDVAASFQELARHRDVSLLVNPDATQRPAGGAVERADNDLPIEADAGKITIALSNLVKNAITFSKPGGHVRIETEAVPGFAKVSVIDDGLGIPAKDLPRIFERFFQVESHLTRRHSGMGLGLAVAKVMIEMHGGRIWAESMEGKGSTFSFLLPMEAGKGNSSVQAI